MYDLTGGWRIGKLHRRLSRRAGVAPLPDACHLDRLAAASSTTTPPPTTPGSRSPSPAPPPQHGAVVANRCPGRRARTRSRRPGRRRRRRRRRRTIDGRGPRRRQRRRRVGRRRAGARRGRPSRLDPPGQGRAHHPAVVARRATTSPSIIPVRRDKRSLFLVPWGALGDGTFRHVYVGTTDTDYDGSIDDPQCTARRHRLHPRQRSTRSPSTTGDHRARHHRHVGGAATAREGRRRLAGAPPTCPAGTRSPSSEPGVVTVTGGKLTTYREMAADTVDACRDASPGRARRAAARKRLPLLGAERLPRRRRRRARRRPSRPAGTGRRPTRSGPGRVRRRARRAAGRRPARTCAAEAVYAVRHEMATTLDDVLARRTRAHLLDRARHARRGADVAALIAGELGWDDAETRSPGRPTTRRCAPQRSAGTPRATPRGPHRRRRLSTSPTPPIELTGTRRHGGTGHVELADDFVDRAVARSARWSPTTTRSPRRAATGGRWRCTGRSTGEVPQLPHVVVRPATTDRWPPSLARCNIARVPLTVAGGRSGVCGARGPGLRRCRARHDGAVGHRRRSTTSSGIVEVLAGHVRPRPRARRCRTTTACRSATSHRASTSRPSAGGWRPAAPVSTRPATARSKTWSSGSRSCSPTARSSSPAAPRPLPSGPTSPSCSRLGGHARRHHEGVAAHPSAPAARAPGRLRVRLRSPTGIEACRAIAAARRDAGRAAALRRRGVGAWPRRRRHDVHAAGARRGRRRDRRRDDGGRRRGVRRGRRAPADAALVAEWLEHRNDTSALAGADPQGIRGRHDGDRRAVVGAAGVCSTTSARRSLAVPTRAPPRATCRTATPTAPASTSRSPPLRPPDEIESTYVALWDAGQRAVLAGGGNLSHHHGVGLNRARFVAEALGAGARRAAAIKSALDPHGILNPGKLGLPVAVRRGALAVTRTVSGRWDGDGASRAGALRRRSCSPCRVLDRRPAHRGRGDRRLRRWRCRPVLLRRDGRLRGRRRLRGVGRSERGTPLSHAIVTAERHVPRRPGGVRRDPPRRAATTCNWFGVFFTLGLVLLRRRRRRAARQRAPSDAGSLPSTRAETSRRHDADPGDRRRHDRPAGRDRRRRR